MPRVQAYEQCRWSPHECSHLTGAVLEHFADVCQPDRLSGHEELAHSKDQAHLSRHQPAKRGSRVSSLCAVV